MLSTCYKLHRLLGILKNKVIDESVYTLGEVYVDERRLLVHI